MSPAEHHSHQPVHSLNSPSERLDKSTVVSIMSSSQEALVSETRDELLQKSAQLRETALADSGFRRLPQPHLLFGRTLPL